MSLLKKAVNTTAYLKGGLLGFAGSGKTHTASHLAIGLSKDIGDDKPVAFFDTETGSDYLIHAFEAAKIELLVAKTRSFQDLIAFMKEAEQQCSVAIIDSISHVWTELLESYQRRLKRRNGLLFQDWGPIKTEWRQFTDLYLNSRMHVILCGRAGYEYDMETNEAGKKELIKSGTKMRAETEMGYEPSLLLEMERLRKEDGHGWIHRCWVLKDRTGRINGKAIDNPTYEDFRPVISFLNVKGTHLGVDTTRNSDDMFDDPDYSAVEYKKRIDITLELIKEQFVLHELDGSSAQVKRARARALIKAFGTSAWTAISDKRLPELETGLDRLRALLASDDDDDASDDNADWGLPRAVNEE